jgi:hypothetical protein
MLTLSVKQANIFNIQNDFMIKAAGSGPELRDILVPVKITHKESKNAEITSKSGNLYHFSVSDSTEPGFINFTIDGAKAGGGGASAFGGRQRPLYLFIQSRQIDYIWYIKGNQSEGHNIKNYPYIIDMQYFGDTDEIEISLKAEENASGDFEMYACYFDEDAFLEAYEILNKNPLKLDSFSDTRLSGTVKAERAGVLFTSIPYDRGWNVKLDGVRLAPDEIELFGEGFIAIKLKRGTHNVEFSYMPVNFRAGLIISLSSAVALAALVFIRRRRIGLCGSYNAVSL